MPLIDLDRDRQEKAREYARIKRRLMLVELGMGGVYTLVWILFGLSERLKTVLVGFFTNEWLLVAGFAFVFGGVYYLLSLPLSFYLSFSLPHRYEISTQTLNGWISDQIKGLLVVGVLGGFVLEAVYALLRWAPETWWLWAASLLLLFDVVLANLAPIFLMPLFYKFELLSDSRGDLVERLIQMADQTGTKVRGVYKFDMSRRTKAANAALTGLGNTRRILLGDTLLAEFSDDEIETVLAHELGHHVHKDIPIGIVVQGVLTLGGFYFASFIMRWGVTLLGFDGPGDAAGMPLFMLVMGLYGLMTMPIGNAYSRWRERLADKYALEVIQMGNAYASALVRLANQNLADADPEPWVEMLLYSHPALSKRIAMARGSEAVIDGGIE